MRRGFTVVEMMMSITIMIIAIAASMYLFTVVNGNLRRVRLVGDAQESARLGLSALESDLHMAGLGFGSGQVGIAPGGGSGRRIPAFYLGPNITITEPGGQTNITNSIFIIMSNPSSLGIPISNSGSLGVVVTASQGVPLSIQCDNAAGTNVDCATLITTPLSPLIVGDFTNAVYLTPTALSVFNSGSPTQTLTYAEEAGAAFAPDPHAPFGFTPGANISVARVVHWYVKQTGTGLPQLVRSYPTLTGNSLSTICSSGDTPFLDETNTGTVEGTVMATSPVENLQIRFVTDPLLTNTPSSYQMINSIGVCDISVPATVRSVRVEVESVPLDYDIQTGGSTRQRAIYSTPTFEGSGPTPSTTMDAYPRRAFTMTVVPRNLQGSRI